MVQEQSSEGPPPLSLSQEAKEAALENPSANDELDTPTSIASVMTSTNESSTETDTPQQTDTEVRGTLFGNIFSKRKFYCIDLPSYTSIVRH